MHVFNPVPNSVRKSDMPSGLSIGAAVSLNKGLFVGVETGIITGQKLFIRTGFEYEAVKNFQVRGGFSTENSSFSFGLGYLLKSMKIDLSFSTHDRLGVTSSVSIIFKIR
jgi:hypothetical protein